MLGAEVTRDIRGPCMLAATLTPSSSTPPSNGRGSNTRSLSIVKLPPVKLRLQEHGHGPVRTPCSPFELAILVTCWEKNGKKEKRKKKKKNRIGLLNPLPTQPLASFASMRGTPPPWRSCAYSSKLALLPCHTSAPLFMHARNRTERALHPSHHKQSFTHSIQNAKSIQTSSSKPPVCAHELKGRVTARGSRGWVVERERRTPTSTPRRGTGQGGSASL
jgi:hypothetical protein